MTHHSTGWTRRERALFGFWTQNDAGIALGGPLSSMLISHRHSRLDQRAANCIGTCGEHFADVGKGSP